MCVPELRGGVAYFNLIFLKSFIKFVTIKKKVWYVIPKIGEGDAYPINEQIKDDFDTLYRQHNFTRTRVHSN